MYRLPTPIDLAAVVRQIFPSSSRAHSVLATSFPKPGMIASPTVPTYRITPTTIASTPFTTYAPARTLLAARLALAAAFLEAVPARPVFGFRLAADIRGGEDPLRG
jgi:hypothetical protein